ncbi:MAG: VWA domain-containing protein [Lentisphaerae bacterium]|nr:VWA domain-containing protein [Lentisphaerota bacterium]
MQFSFPWAFILLLVLPLLVFGRRRHKSPALRFSSLKNAGSAGGSFRGNLVFIPFLLRLVSIVLIIIALARPQEGTERIKDISKGIAIEMLVDRSGSMGAEMMHGGLRLTRFEVVKRVFMSFVEGDGKSLQGRPNDLIGMIAFARYPDTVAPLTLSHGVLRHFLTSLELPTTRQEDGTAIGDALALAAARLKTAEETLARQTGDRADQYEIKNKVILLLSDGANNCGVMAPLEAAALAKKWGITVYSIGIAGKSSGGFQTPFGMFGMGSEGDMDEKTLKAVADMTGGKYWRADDGRALEKACAELDNLEKSEMESVRFVDYREMYLPFVLAAFLLLVLELILNNTLFRRIP